MEIKPGNDVQRAHTGLNHFFDDVWSVLPPTSYESGIVHGQLNAERAPGPPMSLEQLGHRNGQRLGHEILNRPVTSLPLLRPDSCNFLRLRIKAPHATVGAPENPGFKHRLLTPLQKLRGPEETGEVVVKIYLGLLCCCRCTILC